MNFSKEDYFKRQTTLSEIGKLGQQLLQKSKVLVIGCGGLGSPVAMYLAASGIGNIHLVDFDAVSISNLHRQVFYSKKNIGKSKAEILSKKIKKLTPFTKVSFSKNAVSKENILKLITDFDVVVDGTDVIQVKYLINDACVLLNKPLVYGSLYKFDGYVATFNVKNEVGEYSCNLRDAFPKIAKDIPNCESAGTMNPIVGLIAMLQVNEVIKLITKTGSLLIDKLLIYNTIENSQLKISLTKNKSLNVESIFKNSKYEVENCEVQDSSLLISMSEFKKICSKESTEVISILNNANEYIPFKVQQKIPYNTFNIELFQPNFDKKYVIVCQKGITSYQITKLLKKTFPSLSVLSLAEGIIKY